MENIGRLSKYQLQQLIMSEIAELGIDHELVRVDIRKGDKVLVSGEVYSKPDKNIVLVAVMDIVGEENVIDALEVSDGLYDDPDEYGNLPADGMYDMDADRGTEDIYQSIEDGIPYIPPDSPSSEDME